MADPLTVRNLYVHFPFCRRKCTYCALYSRCGTTEADRSAYVARLAAVMPQGLFETIYFGGGSPALCDLRPIFKALAPNLAPSAEFTVELHPLDVSESMLQTLKAGGVNRISMGVQSLNDSTLAAMGRGYTVQEAARAFSLVKRYFDNAGIDLIVGYPHDSCQDWSQLADWGLTHCSVYSLQNERGLKDVPEDDFVLDRLSEVASFLDLIGVKRYEISNYAIPGRECRHNLATWRGEDYFGLGDGASGRIGRYRTQNWWGGALPNNPVSAEMDALERRIFTLRTKFGLETADHPDWRMILDRFVQEALLVREGTIYRLTPRGMEVCDTILAELV